MVIPNQPTLNEHRDYTTVNKPVMANRVQLGIILRDSMRLNAVRMLY